MTLKEYFDRGDYTSAALCNGDGGGDWRKFAALGLMGKAGAALDGLKGFSGEEPRFYAAAARWIQGDDAGAARALQGLSLPHAKNLLKLLRKPRIEVLAQMDRGSQWDFATALSADKKFHLRNIGFRKDDIQNQPYADVHRFYDAKNPPDFYVTKLVEWHVLPPNLQELPCPILGHTADYDLHIQALHPWLQLFDELIVTDGTEWNDVAKLAAAPVSSFAKSFGLGKGLPPIPQGERPIDVFISGTAMHPYHPDKARLLHQILEMPEINVNFLNGFVAPQEYNALLSRTKAGFTYVRHPGAMPTRGLESLAMGAAIAVQEGSVLRLFVGEEEGVLTYQLESRDLPAALRRILSEWPEFERRARRGAEIVRREFALEKAASQYFRFLTFLAARPRPARKAQLARDLDQKRSILLKGWVQKPKVHADLRDQGMTRWLAQLEMAPGPRPVIDMSRELLLEYATAAYSPVARDYAANFDVDLPVKPELLQWSLQLLRAGIRKFPQSLPLRFNFIRAALHFGNPAEVSEATAMAKDALAAPLGQWQVEVMEDVFPWDYFSQFFNYRAYFDCVTRQLETGERAEREMVRLLLASTAYYLSYFDNDTETAGQAVTLDPEFPFYALRSARLLMARGGEGDAARAGELLSALIEHSMLFAPAFRELERLRQSGLIPDSGRFQALAEKVRLSQRRMRTGKYGVEDWESIPLQLADDMAKAKTSSHRTGALRQRILFLPLEFSSWNNARRLAYPAQTGLLEGLQACGAEVLTVPAVHGLSAPARSAWLAELRKACAGRKFDQVWLELVHTDWDADTLEWVASLAPVRAGFVMESLRYDEEAYAIAPQLRKRHSATVQRLRFMTHALLVDEQDADLVSAQHGIRALWWPQAVPASSIVTPGSARNNMATFCGQLYGERQLWLEHPELKKLVFHVRQLPEDATPFPALFDEAHHALDRALADGVSGPDWLSRHHALIARARREIFDLWMRSLQDGIAVVNLPSLFRGYAGRVYEAMAAGRPVISWNPSERPRTAALFEDGKEILLFGRKNPDAMAEHVRRIQRDPLFAKRLAEAAQRKVREFHTIERRVEQILHWIETGVEPSYGELDSQRAGRAETPEAGAAFRSPDESSLLPALQPPASSASNLHGVWGKLLLRLESGSEGAAHLRAAVEANPKNIAAWLELSRHSLSHGDDAGFQKSLGAVLDFDGLNLEALALLETFAARKEWLGLARQVNRVIIGLAPRQLAARVSSACLALAGADGEIENPFKRWVESRLAQTSALAEELKSAASGKLPRVAQIGSLAEARELLQRGQRAEAWASACGAIRSRPFHPEGWLLLAEMAKGAGDIALARSCAGRAAQMAPRLAAAVRLAKELAGVAASASSGWEAPAFSSSPRLSVCLIVKNEEQFLEKCLRSARGVAAQIVVADTGSTDRTVEIAQAAGAEVIHIRWTDDFSAARNAALERAWGDWVLILDADEELTPDGRGKLIAEMQDGRVMACRLPIIDAGREEEGRSYVPRLFRNAPGLFFTGRIHEQIFTSVETLRKSWGLENKLGSAALLHHGYTKDVTKARNKNARNLRLLEQAVEESPNDPSLVMNLGLELVRAGRLRAGLDHYWNAFALMSQLPDLPPELREALLTQLGVHLMAARAFQDVVFLYQSPLAKAGGLTASMHFALALAYLKQEKFKESADEMRQCLAKRNRPALSPILPEIHKARPNHCLACCLWKLKRPAEADAAFHAALVDDPASRPARKDYVEFLQDQDRLVEALEFLHQWMSEQPDDVEVWQMGGRIALSRAEYLEFALDWTLEALKACPADAELVQQRAEALLLAGEAGESRLLWGKLSAPSHRANAGGVIAALLAGGEFPEFAREDEPAVSKEFFKWYRQFLNWGREELVTGLNGRLEIIQQVLPSAGQALAAALEEAGTEELAAPR